MDEGITIAYSPRQIKWSRTSPYPEYSTPSETSSVSSLTLAVTPITLPSTPKSLSPPSGLTPSYIAASPHDTLMFNPSAEISFEIQDVVEVIHAPPIRNSVMPPIVEYQIKIANGARETCIPAAEMTSSMQAKLRKLSSEELKRDYRVTRSNEVGSKGLYTFTKPEWSRARPKSLQLGILPSPFAGLKTPRSALTSATKGLFGFLTPSSISPAALEDATRESYFG